MLIVAYYIVGICCWLQHCYISQRLPESSSHSEYLWWCWCRLASVLHQLLYRCWQGTRSSPVVKFLKNILFLAHFVQFQLKILISVGIAVIIVVAVKYARVYLHLL